MAEDKKTSAEKAGAVQELSTSALNEHLRLGATIQVVSQDNRALKYVCRLIGSDGANALITSLPTPKQLKQEYPKYDEIFNTGHSLVMRVVVDGTIFAFHTFVAGVFETKGKMLITTFPKKTQQQSLRKEGRYHCTLLCSNEGGASPWPGVITNISLHGCQLHIKDKDAIVSLQDMKENNKPLTMRVLFPTEEGQKEIKGLVKAVDKGEKRDIVVGVAFTAGISHIKAYFERLQLEGMLDILSE